MPPRRQRIQTDGADCLAWGVEGFWERLAEMGTLDVHYQKSVHLGDYVAPRGSICLHQLAKSATAVGGAAARIITIFLHEYVPTRLVLSVRADNTSAWQFYERHGLQRIGNVRWQHQGHPLLGYVYEWIRPVDMTSRVREPR